MLLLILYNNIMQYVIYLHPLGYDLQITIFFVKIWISVSESGIWSISGSSWYLDKDPEPEDNIIGLRIWYRVIQNSLQCCLIIKYGFWPSRYTLGNSISFPPILLHTIGSLDMGNKHYYYSAIRGLIMVRSRIIPTGSIPGFLTHDNNLTP